MPYCTWPSGHDHSRNHSDFCFFVLFLPTQNMIPLQLWAQPMVPCPFRQVERSFSPGVSPFFPLAQDPGLVQRIMGGPLILPTCSKVALLHNGKGASQWVLHAQSGSTVAAQRTRAASLIRTANYTSCPTGGHQREQLIGLRLQTRILSPELTPGTPIR